MFHGNYAFYHDHGAGDLGLEDPVFLKRLEDAGIDPKKNPKEAGAKWIDENIWHGHAHTWAKMPWLIQQWKEISGGKPMMLKGIQSVADAKKAVELGVDGIVVSNHAGRQVDGAIASLDALEKIADAVGDQTTVSSNVMFSILWRMLIVNHRSCLTREFEAPPTSSKLWHLAPNLSLSGVYGSGA